ncbi:AAA family ATPase [Psychrobium sp. 1_MG-2023]|uniref:AAA family ATPase n=1 Tax=Psychrobium sp. 1_MG-2023 TaxID=3062624 RepID=UPI002734CA7F|nr:AAA family ATPase [Psychrobium sp. 1_MG-2023]MDP2560992.1 AAA family ATPase [Psychrobium sp. 1_MG-2023]
METQVQLLSRLELAFSNYSLMSFLHGPSGVGKSYLCAQLQNSQLNSQVIHLNYKSAVSEAELKQQIACEIATDDFLDTSLPLSQIVNSRIKFLGQSLLIVIDNAHELNHGALGMLWQSVNEFNRIAGRRNQFNILLVGDTSWAMPLFKALDKSTDSLTSEFNLLPLNQEQATDFMLAIHTHWSDEKIKAFIHKIPEQYLLPKQLIYAEESVLTQSKTSLLLKGVIGFCVFILIAVAVGYIAINRDVDNDSSPTTVSAESEPLAIVETEDLSEMEVGVVSAGGELTSNIKPNNEQKQSLDVVVNEFEEANVAVELATSSVVKATVQPSSDSVDSTVNNPVIEPKPIEDAEERESTQQVFESPTLVTQPVKADNVILGSNGEDQLSVIKPSYAFDEHYLLSLSEVNFSLMLGGFSSELVLNQVVSEISRKELLYRYYTVRNGGDWYVLLYGNFDSIGAAREQLSALPSHLNKFSPWAKPIKAVQQEIRKVELFAISESKP